MSVLVCMQEKKNDAAQPDELTGALATHSIAA